MSFYGNILNRLDKAFSSIRVNSTSIEAEGSKDIITFTGESGITLTTEGKTIKIAGDKVITNVEVKNSIENDNKLQYLFTYANGDTYYMDIPLDSFLSNAEVVTEDDDGNLGQFLKLTFKTDESVFEPIYVDMSTLLTLQEDIQITGPVGRVTQDDIDSGNGAYLWECQGMTIPRALNDLLSKSVPPTVTPPTLELESSNIRAYEVGSKVAINYNFITTPGSYQYGPDTGVTFSNFSATFNGKGPKTGSGQEGTFDEVTVTDSTDLKIEGSATHTDGVIPRDNLGADCPDAKIITNTLSDSKGTLKGYRNSFYGAIDNKNNINSNLIRTLTPSNKALSNGSTFTINIGETAKRVIIAYPSTLRNLTSVLDVNDSNSNIVSGFGSPETISVEGANGFNAIGYKVYIMDFANAYGTTNTFKVTI